LLIPRSPIKEAEKMDVITADILTADILVVGGGTGGPAPPPPAARKDPSLKVVLVSELPWLGGMLSAAGVCAPDGNELAAFQTGIWGAFLKALRQRQPTGLSHGWVSFFTYSPAVGAQIFADWVNALPNLQWIDGQRPREVLRDGEGNETRITGVVFDSLTVHAKITLDGTELGDLLSLAEVPYRWSWETRDGKAFQGNRWQEPSAPVSLSDPQDPLYAITQRYPVQSPTWVVVLQDYDPQGTGQSAPPIAEPPILSPDSDFDGAWANYGDDQTPAGEAFLNYGCLPHHQFMINWPHQGNDYGVGLHRLIESAEARSQYAQEAQWHSQSFARYIQRHLGPRYGLAESAFPKTAHSPGGGFALMPYYRESRRLQGLTTICENDILPITDGQVAALPINSQGHMSAIALGNYPNDHHYPGFEMPLAPKAIRWGGRWTGTPFTIPYEALVPETVDGLLVCEKNISVSHIANGATRLQPLVLGIGQAAGMAAALCAQNNCQPRDLIQPKMGGVRSLQQALIQDPTAPAALIPLFNLPPEHPQWQAVQQHYLNNPESYSPRGYHPFEKHLSQNPSQHLSQNRSQDNFNPETAYVDSAKTTLTNNTEPKPLQNFDPSVSVPSASVSQEPLLAIKGEFYCKAEGHYELHQRENKNLPNSIHLLTVRSEITELFIKASNAQQVYLLGIWNSAGKWLLCEQINLL
jgi:hypothetical protein